MFIPRLSASQLKGMRRAGASAARTLAHACAQIRPGLDLGALDQRVRAHTAGEGGTPAQLGYQGFPASLCVSPNQVVCHGIPRRGQRLAEGDIVNLDVTTCLRGWHGDTSRMVAVGPISPEAQHLIQTTERAMWAGIRAIRVGAPLGVIGDAVERLAQAEGCAVVRDYGGHGIGRRMHLPPHVHHHAGTGGPTLREGMCLTVEPMLVLGSPELRTLEDGWTVVTADGSLAAQFEHTLCVTRDGPEVLTLPPDT